MTPQTKRILTRICRLIISITFIFSGFTKVIDPWGTAIKINEYLAIYGLEELSGASMALSIWLCGAEMMMGCMMLFKVRIRMVSLFSFCSMIFFTVLSFLSATVLPVEDCGCFGDAIHLTPWQTFFKNLVLMPISTWLWWRYRNDKIFAFNLRELIAAIVIFSSIMTLGAYCYYHLPLIDFRPYKVGVNIYEEMHAAHSASADELQTVLVYRNIETGDLQEFTLDDVEWQDETKWEWVDTVVSGDVMEVRSMIEEFSLRDLTADCTEELLTLPGRLYMICVTDFDRVSRSCERRLGDLVRRAAAQEARIICITPASLREQAEVSFDGAPAVPCYNIDATTMKTMLRARTGVVTLDDGVIADKRNCRDVGR